MSKEIHLESDHRFADNPLFRKFPRYVAMLVFSFGVLAVISWHAHWTAILQFQADTIPMQYTTALCFVLCGIAQFLLTARQRALAPWIGGIIIAFYALTLLEYLTHGDFGIDELFYKPYFDVATVHIGRTSPLTCLSFIFIGLGFVLAGWQKSWSKRLAGSGILACVVIVIAAVGLAGYVVGLKPAYGWGAYSNMAINTAILILLLGFSLLAWSWDSAIRENYNFVRWLPVTASVTLMAMIAFVSAANMSELRSASVWRKHNFEVILASQSFEDNFIDMQRGLRGALTMRDANAWASYINNSRQLPSQYDHLVALTAGDDPQQIRLKHLAAAMQDAAAYDGSLIEIYHHGGLPAVFQNDQTGQGRVVFGQTISILKDFSQAQQKLLDQRDASAETDYHRAEYLLVFGAGLAAFLIIIAHRMASRELRERRRAESKLREVSTLQNAILDSSNYAIIATDSRGVVQSYNLTAEKMLGYTAAEVIGFATPLLWRDAKEIQTLIDLAGPGPDGAPRSSIDALIHRITSAKTCEYEATFVHKNKKHFPVLVSATALMDAAGHYTGILGIAADISERQQREAALRESEQRFRLAFDNGPIGMALVSPLGHFLRVNHALCLMLGYSENELRATDFQTITHPEDLEKDLAFLQQVLEGEIHSYQMEKRYFHKNGQIVFIRLNVSLVRDPDGQPSYFVSQIENISELKLREEEREKLIAELRQSLTRVRTLSGLIPICGWCKNVRTDKGFWQTVEQYVLAQTDATFSHGMCPDCQQKFRDDITRANTKPDPAADGENVSI